MIGGLVGPMGLSLPVGGHGGTGAFLPSVASAGRLPTTDAAAPPPHLDAGPRRPLAHADGAAPTRPRPVHTGAAACVLGGGTSSSVPFVDDYDTNYALELLNVGGSASHHLLHASSSSLGSQTRAAPRAASSTAGSPQMRKPRRSQPPHGGGRGGASAEASAAAGYSFAVPADAAGFFGAGAMASAAYFEAFGREMTPMDAGMARGGAGAVYAKAGRGQGGGGKKQGGGGILRPGGKAGGGGGGGTAKAGRAGGGGGTVVLVGSAEEGAFLKSDNLAKLLEAAGVEP